MPADASSPVLVDVHNSPRGDGGGDVATLTLNRPDKRNSVSYDMWLAIGDAVESLARTEVRVLIVRGAGDHFCAGADISELSNGTGGAYGEANWRAEEALANFPAPTIAMIRGNCVGGGVSIATACDIRIADNTAVFGITPAKLGIVYPTNALERAVRLIGPSATKLLMYGADLVAAELARDIRLVDEVHEPAGLQQRVDSLASTFVERSLLTQVATKQMIDQVMRHGAVSPELAATWADQPVESGELAEGVAAFTDRRSPRFPWRRA